MNFDLQPEDLDKKREDRIAKEKEFAFQNLSDCERQEFKCEKCGSTNLVVPYLRCKECNKWISFDDQNLEDVLEQEFINGQTSMRELMQNEQNTPAEPSEFCHCGMPRDEHNPSDNHSFIPMNCTCGYAEIKQCPVHPTMFQIRVHELQKENELLKNEIIRLTGQMR
jgi:hypothetical protein